MANHRRLLFRISIALFVVFALLLTVSLLYWWPSLTREPIGPPRHPLPDTVDCPQGASPWREFELRFVGHAEESIIDRFGPPAQRWKGHYGAPPVNYQRSYPGAFSMTYERPSGTLYLSFCVENGQVVCFGATWLPKGTMI